ncbi:MAG: diaminopimelate decarboxylase, partial [Rikenellaceae bacterium]
MLSRQVADKLKGSGVDTPFYLYDIALLRQTLESVVYESKKYGYKVHYAIKANYDDKILAVIKEYGLGIDCASGNELRKAIEAGFDPKGIVYAGVGKRDKELDYAIDQKIMAINCESVEELEVISALSVKKGVTTDVALRINPDIDPKTNHCIDTGQADSKFGISYEEVMEQAEHIKALPNLDIKGIHIHIGSQIRELHVFENMCNKANVIVENLERLGFSFDFVDVGGGLGINYDVPENEPIPNFASLFSIVNNHLNVGGKSIHFEFGRSIVGECGELITTVLFNKTTATGRRLLIVDASMTELIRPALYGSYHNIENISSNSDHFQKYTVVGTACESTDVFQENLSLR